VKAIVHEDDCRADVQVVREGIGIVKTRRSLYR
jgi:hypothetical protein